MKSAYRHEAFIEMVNAARYYDSCRNGLGKRFLEAIDSAVEDIESNPKRWPMIKGDCRRRMVERFPHAVVYRIYPEEVLIVAVMDLRRKPYYWLGRLTK